MLIELICPGDHTDLECFIIVSFRDFCDTQSIMERAYVLRNTCFSVAYDLSKEINDARKKVVG